MTATLIIEQRGEGYIYDLFSAAETKRGVRCGKTPQEAATKATRLLASLQQAEEDFAIIAPDAVLNIIPEHLRGTASPEQRTLRLKAVEWAADFLIAVYGERSAIPVNVEQFAMQSPLKAIGLVAQRREMPANNLKVAELMELIDDPDVLNFGRPATLEEQAAFSMRLYRSPYLNQ